MWDNLSQSEGNSSLQWDNSSLAEEPMLTETKLPQWFLVLHFVVRVLEGLLALFGNGLTIVAITKFDFLKTTSNIFICGLAGADTLGGLVPILIIIRYPLQAHFKVWHILCVIEQTLSIFTSSLNVIIIGIIAVERCIYISFPLHYPNLVTTQIAKGLIIGIWIAGVFEMTIFLSLGIGQWEGMTCRSSNVFIHPACGIVNMTLFITLTTIIIAMYGRIACIACHQANKVQEVQQSSDQQINKKAGYKVTKMMVIVLGVYLVCFVPHMLIHAVIGKKMKYQPLLIIFLERVLSWVWWMSSWANPLVYAWNSKDFARGFRLLLHMKPAPTDTTMCTGATPTN